MAIELADKLYTSTQVADILGVSLRTLYRYMEDNKIKSMRTASGRHRFTKDHIIEFLNAGRMGMEEVSQAPSYNSPRNSGYPNQPQNQAPVQNTQRGNYFDNMQAPANNMSNPYGSVGGFQQNQQQASSGNNMYGQDNNSVMHGNNFQQPQVSKYSDPVQPTVEADEDDFEFDVTTDYDYDKPAAVETPQSNIAGNQFNDDFEDDFDTPKNNFGQERNDNRYEQPQQAPAQAQQPASPRPNYASSPFAPPAPIAAQDQRSQAVPESRAETFDANANLNVRYYRSDYTDLIELAKKIKDTSNAKDLEYAFTLYAGLSLHFLIRPFTVLNFYANPEDMQLWKDELRLVPSQRKEDANVGIIINTDIVFVPTKEIGGFKVVDDKVLLKDLSAVREEDLVKQFRQHLTSI